MVINISLTKTEVKDEEKRTISVWAKIMRDSRNYLIKSNVQLIQIKIKIWRNDY